MARSLRKRTLKLLSVTALLSACTTTSSSYKSPQEWITASKAGPYLPLADKAETWSDGKVFQTPAGGQLEVKSKFLQQQGTTCTYDIQFKNVGSGSTSAQVTLGKADQTGVYSHRLTGVSLDPGKSVAYEMEQRECPLRFGTHQEMDLCAECKPVVVFLK